MLILALDSCGGAVSVCCLDQPGDDEAAGRILGHVVARTQTGQAAILAPQIRSVMRQAALPYAALDRLAVTVGPGSFTGLRIGIAAARGLALATGKALYGITAFAAMAAATPAPAGRPVLVALDSRRGDLFVQLFRAGDPVSPPDVARPDALRGWLARWGVDAAAVIVAGDGAEAAIAESRLAGAPTEQDRFIDARDVARLAARLPPNETLDTLPVYLRPPDAMPARPGGLPAWKEPP